MNKECKTSSFFENVQLFGPKVDARVYATLDPNEKNYRVKFITDDDSKEYLMSIINNKVMTNEEGEIFDIDTAVQYINLLKQIGFPDVFIEPVFENEYY